MQKTFDAHLIPEILVMTALLKQDPAAARWWWHQFESKRKRADGLGYWSARTAWHWMEGHTADAWQALQQWEERAQKLPRTGAYDYDRRQAALLRTGMCASANRSSSAGNARSSINCRVALDAVGISCPCQSRGVSANS